MEKQWWFSGSNCQTVSLGAWCRVLGSWVSGFNPWHTLEKNWIIRVRRELNPVHRDPGDPCSNKTYKISMSHQRSFMSVQTFHTHTHTKIYESQLEIIIPGGIPDLFVRHQFNLPAIYQKPPRTANRNCGWQMHVYLTILYNYIYIYWLVWKRGILTVYFNFLVLLKNGWKLGVHKIKEGFFEKTLPGWFSCSAQHPWPTKAAKWGAKRMGCRPLAITD